MQKGIRANFKELKKSAIIRKKEQLFATCIKAEQWGFKIKAFELFLNRENGFAQICSL